MNFHSFYSLLHIQSNLLDLQVSNSVTVFDLSAFLSFPSPRTLFPFSTIFKLGPLVPATPKDNRKGR
jgi:hypothetical protein